MELRLLLDVYGLFVRVVVAAAYLLGWLLQFLNDSGQLFVAFGEFKDLSAVCLHFADVHHQPQGCLLLLLCAGATTLDFDVLVAKQFLGLFFRGNRKQLLSVQCFDLVAESVDLLVRLGVILIV